MEFPSKVDYFPMTAQYSLLVSCFNTSMSLELTQVLMYFKITVETDME